VYKPDTTGPVDVNGLPVPSRGFRDGRCATSSTTGGTRTEPERPNSYPSRIPVQLLVRRIEDEGR
jgi:hypothetical protein